MITEDDIIAWQSGERNGVLPELEDGIVHNETSYYSDDTLIKNHEACNKNQLYRDYP